MYPVVMAKVYQRARRPEQIEERRTHLIHTARKMLSKNLDLEAVGLNALARQAAMTKSNVYRYFESREALLLAVLWEEWTRWFEVFSRVNARGFPKSKKSGAREQELVRLLARTLAERKLLCFLTASVPTVLERNLSDPAIREFKLGSLRLLDEAGEWMHRMAPRREASHYAKLVYDAACLMAGLFPHAHPAQGVARVLKDRRLAFFRHDLRVDLERVLLALARGPA